MCDPTAIAIASTAIQVGGAVAGHAAQNRAYTKNAGAALSAERLQLADLGERQLEERKALISQEGAVARQAAQAAGVAEASAAASNVAGPSVDLLLGDLKRQQGNAEQTLQDNYTVTIDQLQRMKQGVEAQAESRINAVPKASWLNTGLKIAGAGIGLAGTLEQRYPSGITNDLTIPTAAPGVTAPAPVISVPGLPKIPPIIQKVR